MTAARRALVTAIVLTIAGLTTATIGHGRRQFAPERPFRAVTGGAQRLFGAIGRGVGDTVRSVGELRQVREDYEALLERVEDAERLAGEIDALERENRLLREQLGFAARSATPVLAARIIARQTGTTFESVTINRGTRHGLSVGHAVIAYNAGQRGIVGRIADVSGGTAIVRPVTSTASFIGARLDRSRVEGLLEGDGVGENVLTLRYVPRDARNEIRYGDLVVTSGTDSMFPADEPIGTVERVTAPAYEESLVIQVVPIVDFSRLEYVFVLLQGPAGEGAL